MKIKQAIQLIKLVDTINKENIKKFQKTKTIKQLEIEFDDATALTGFIKEMESHLTSQIYEPTAQKIINNWCNYAFDLLIERKAIPEILNVFADGYYDGELVYDMYKCPNCSKFYEIETELYYRCPNCGQDIDWRELLLTLEKNT